MKYTIRPWVPEDAKFVMDNWLNSWRTNRYAGVIRNCDYYNATRTLIEDLISRGATVLVADHGRTLLGFACGEVKDGMTVHHYTFQKDLYASKVPDLRSVLLDALPGDKPGWFTFYQPHPPGWRHAPEMARRKAL